jgi:hypothetical protein
MAEKENDLVTSQVDRQEASPAMKSLALCSVGQAFCLSGFRIVYWDKIFENYSNVQK